MKKEHWKCKREKLEEQRRIEREKLEEQRRIEREMLEDKLAYERQLAAVRIEEKEKEKKFTEAFSLVKARKLVPNFDEKEPDIFFTTFEDTASTLGWPQDQFVLLIRSELKGKAAHIAAQLVGERDSPTFKKAILDAYSITIEGYRQSFRNSFKGNSQTYLDFFQLKIKQFKKWIESEGIATFEELQNLVILEEFLRRIPANIAMYIRERQEKDGQKAAILAMSIF